VSALQNIKVTMQLNHVPGTPSTYDRYYGVLLQAACAHDKTIAASTRSSTRRVLMADSFYDDDPNVAGETYDLDELDLDLPVEEYMVHQQYQSRRQGRRNCRDTQGRTDAAHLPQPIYKDLQPDGQYEWQQLSTKTRNILLEHLKQKTAAPTGSFRDRPSSLRDRPRYNDRGKRLDSKRLVQFHDSLDDGDGFVDDVEESDADDGNNGGDDAGDDAGLAWLVNVLKTGRIKTLPPPGDIRRVLSDSANKSPTKHGRSKSTTHEVTFHERIYSVSESDRRSGDYSLVDRGANGGLAGVDVRVIDRMPHSKVNVRGIQNHEIVGVPIANVRAYTEHTTKGPVIILMNQYAYVGRGKSIHSSAQMEHFGLDVNEKSLLVEGGLQQIRTPDGCQIPLPIQSGLARLKIRPFTDQEFATLPHVVLTNDDPWNPSVLDYDPTDDPKWKAAVEKADPAPAYTHFDDIGDYRHRVALSLTTSYVESAPNSLEASIDALIRQVATSTTVGSDDFYDASEDPSVDVRK